MVQATTITVSWQVHMLEGQKAADVSPGSSSYVLALSDALLSRLRPQPMGGYRLAWLHGAVGPPANLVPVYMISG